MKNTFNIYYAVARSLAILLTLQVVYGRDMSKLIPYLDSQEPKFIERHKSSHSEESLTQLLEKLREGNPIEVKHATSQLAEMHEGPVLLLMLENCGMYEKELAAVALQDVAQIDSLKRLIDALDRENKEFSGPIASNAEMDAAIRSIQTSLVKAIERVTGIQYDYTRNFSRDSIVGFENEVKSTKQFQERLKADVKYRNDQSVSVSMKDGEKSGTHETGLGMGESPAKGKRHGFAYVILLAASSLAVIGAVWYFLRSRKRHA